MEMVAMRLALRLSVLALALAPFPLAGASAAPQVLALVASAEPVPMVCRNGACSAEMSAFCLQPEWQAPVEGTAYYPKGGEGIRVVATTRGGETLTFAPAELGLEVESARTHTAVRLKVPVEEMIARDLDHAAIEVGRGVSLVPVPVAGDPRPHSEQDITIAIGPLRALGTRLVDEGGAPVAAARLANRLISALPARGRTDDEARASLWHRVMGDAAGGGAISLARGAYDDCHARTMGGMMSLRECLSAAHDRFIGGLNDSYWDAAKTGS
jgi:hypothetical protein